MANPLEQYRDSDFQQMKRVEDAVIGALLPFRESTDPILAVLALARILRVFLRAAPKLAQRQLLRVLIAYIEGRTRLPGDDRDAGKLWVPHRSN